MISEHLSKLSRDNPDQLAFSFKGRDNTTQSVSYAELDRDARHIAATLIKNNPTKKPVYIAMRQSIGFVKVLFGAIYSGITFLPTYPIRNAHDIARLKSITQTVEPAFIIVDDVAPINELGEHVDYDIVAANDLRGDICLDRPEPMAECVFLQCSSGTTRSPKAIQVTRTALTAGLENMCQHFQVTSDDVGCSWLPPYHDMGLIGGILLPVYAGFTTHLMSPSSFMMNPLSWLEYISQVRATITVAPNVAYDLCVRRLAHRHLTLDLSCLRIMVNSAQMIQPRTIDEFIASFQPYGLNPNTLLNAYGLAEATLMVTCTRANEAFVPASFQRSVLRKGVAVPSLNINDRILMANCGKPISGIGVAIVDRKTNCPVEPNQIGEIWVSGNSITGGYYQHTSTADVFHKKIKGHESEFISTGDTGFLSPEGNLFVTGRIKDTIKIRSGLISAEEIEEIVESNDFQDSSYRCAALMITRHDESELVVLREIERDLDPVAHGSQMLYLLRKNYMIDVSKIVYLRRGTIPTTTSGKVKRHAAIVLYMHDLLEPIFEYKFDPSLGLDKKSKRS